MRLRKDRSTGLGVRENEKKGEGGVKLEDIELGMTVLYVPLHAHGKLDHPAVERGKVTSKNERFAFVNFNCQSTSKACRPEDITLA